MSGVALQTAPALVVLGRTAIHTTMGPRVSSLLSSTVEKRAVLSAEYLRPWAFIDSHVVERRVEDVVGSLGGDLEEVGSRRGNGEGVGLDIGTPHELGRVAGDAVVPEVHLILGDQVGGDDGAGVRVVAELRVEGLGLAEGGRGRRGGRLSSVLWGSLDRVLALDTVDHEACHG